MALFQKGQPSANPHGRPKTTKGEKIKSLARRKTREAVKTLEAIMNDPLQPGRTRIAAAEALLDRGYGRPAQTVEAQDGKGNAVTLGVVIVPQKSVLDTDVPPREPDAETEAEAVKH